MRKLIYAISFMLILFSVAATEMPRITPSDWAVSTGSESEPLPLKVLMEASLYASGVPAGRVGEYRLKIEKILSGLPDYLSRGDVNLPTGERVLHYLHETVFTRYYEPQTRVDVILDTGQFNCVSSAVLYMIAARSVGLQVRGVATTDHAFCRVIGSSGGVDVETTNPYGYNPGQKREFTNAFGQTGFTYVPPGNYHLRTELGETELIGLILQNRISLLQRQNRIDLTVPLAVDRYAMTLTDRTRAELRKEFINYASVLNSRRQYTDALSFLDAVREKWGYHDEYLAIIDTLLYNAAVVMSQNGQNEEILAILRKRLNAGDLSAENEQKYRHIVGERLIFTASRQQAPPEALKTLDALNARGLVSAKTYTDYSVILHIKEAQVIARDKGDLAAIDYISQPAVQQLQDARIQRTMDILVHNASASYHNRFVSLFRAQQLDEAEALLQEALAVLPGNRLLLQDLALLKQQ